jgi:alginate O-acetyltransferase complex protein AlgI
MTALHDFHGIHDLFIAPLFDYGLLTKGLLLFTVFFLLLRILPDRARGLLLLSASLFLIGWETSPFYLLLFFAFAVFLYYCLYWIQGLHHRKGLSYLISFLIVVFYFLCLDHPALVSPWTGAAVHHFGIAYSLFRFLSVTLEVGKGMPLPANPVDYLNFVFFQITFYHGPIERLPEFRENLIRPSFLPKTVVAANLFRLLGACLKGWIVFHFLEMDWKGYFDFPQNYSYGMLILMMYVRAISFYLLVSASNDFKIAFAALGGFRLHENYDDPYFKRNIALFWRSWHMTLFRFLRDYVYIPLGGNRRHVYFNILVVFLAAALWHVTSKAFLLWGLWHGLGMCFFRLWQDFWKWVERRDREDFLHSLQRWSRAHSRFVGVFSTLLTFHFVALGWLPFWGGHPQGASMILRIVSGNRWKLFEW